MSIYRQFLFFCSVYFLLCFSISLFLFLMETGYSGFQALYFYFNNGALIIPPIGFFVLSYLIRRFAPQSDGSGYWDMINLLENEARPQYNLKNEVTPIVSYRDFLARLFLTPLSALAGGSVGRTSPVFHMSSAFVLIFKEKIKLPKNTLIYSAVVCCLVILFSAVIAGFVFCLESMYFYRIKKHNNYPKSTRTPYLFAFISKLPFLLLATLISIFWLKILGKWDYSLPQFNFDLAVLSQIVPINFLKLVTITSLLAVTFKYNYAYFSRLVVKHWKIQSIVFGVILSIFIYSFGSKVSGSGIEFIYSEGGSSIEFWQKWLANVVTLNSGITAGLISTSIGVGALISQTFIIPMSIGISAFLAVTINRPFTSAFMISEFLNLSLVETLIGALASYFLFKFFDFLLKKLSFFRL